MRTINKGKVLSRAPTIEIIEQFNSFSVFRVCFFSLSDFGFLSNIQGMPVHEVHSFLPIPVQLGAQVYKQEA